MKDISIEGAVAVLCTPKTKQNQIEENRLREHINNLVENGIDSFISTGGTGEIESLSKKQRMEVSTIVKNQLDKLGIDYVFGIGTGVGTTQDVVEYTNFAKSMGADFVMIRPPATFDLLPEEIRNYYLDILNNTDYIPIMLYAPNSKMSIETVKKLARDKRVQWIKEATGEIERVGQIQDSCKNNIEVVCGSDALSYDMATDYNVKAWVAPPVNPFPNSCALIYELIVAGKKTQAYEFYSQLKPLFDIFEEGIYVQGTKAVMKNIGKSCGDPWKPRIPLQEKYGKRLSDIVELIKTNNVEENAKKIRQN